MKLLLFTVLTFGSISIFAQPMALNPSYYQDDFLRFHDPSVRSDVDNCKMVITYQIEFYRDTVARKKWYDRFALQIGDRLCRYYSLYSAKADSIFLNSNKDVAPYRWRKDNEASGAYQYWFGYPKAGVITYQTKINEMFFQYIEPMPKMPWKPLPGRRVILGHKCLAAQTTFRGRTYKVWYAPDVKISQGPWKFSGLPGAMLYAGDTRGLFVFKALGIRKGKSVEKIYYYKHKYKTVSREQMTALENKMYLDPVGLIYETGIGNSKLIMATDSKGRVIKYKSGDYRYPFIPPLELK